MKKLNINLIINREDYQKYQIYFEYLKISLIVLVFVFFSLFFILFLILKNKTDLEKKLNLQKGTLLEILKDKKVDEVKISYIGKKYQDLSSYLKDDAFSSPYYAFLNSAIQESSESAQLETFLITKSRDVDFTIAFTDFPQLMSFFKFIESETFLKNFETISLKSFSVIGATENQKENYELSFAGKFKPLK